MEIGPASKHLPNVALRRNAREDRDSSESIRAHESCPENGFSPRDVSQRILGPNSQRTACSEDSNSSIIAAQREVIAKSSLLPILCTPSKVEAKGTEHSVRFQGKYVEKHQRGDEWVAVIHPVGKVVLKSSTPIEYLRQLQLQNEHFGDDIRVSVLHRQNASWWHHQENLVLLDARKPNFKKTAFYVLPIDLILSDLTPEMRTLFSRS